VRSPSTSCSKYMPQRLDPYHCVEQAYGASSATVPGNESDTRLFSHQIPPTADGHQMADALAQATDVPNRFPNGLPLRVRLKFPIPDCQPDS